MRIPHYALILVFLVVGTAPADETFRSHVVVSQQGDASEAGREAIRQGGNAIDAAVATAFALAVTHPAAGNIGGGGFIVAYLAESREVVTVDFREMAPKASNERMYLGPDDRPVAGYRAGPRAAGIPGTVRGLGLAHARWGKQPWETLVRPSVRLAREGFPISASLAGSLNGQLFGRDPERPGGVPEDLGPQGDRLGDFEASIAAYRKPDGTRWSEGDRLVQPDLADTLERIATQGPDEFYSGETARKIVAHMERLGGLVTLDDLASYKAVARPPIHGTYKGFEIYGMGPPASGGILIVQMLNILERFDMKLDGPRSPRTLHRVTEAMRRGFFTRASAIADPEFVEIPMERLISKSYGDELARTIGERATPSASLAPFPILGVEGNHTTHLSTLDSSGNAVAMTYTLEEGYGSKSVVEGAGFLLNNEMGDFNLIPGRTDTAGQIGTPSNLIAPRKRMLSSQTPTIVLKDGKVRLVTGSPGGRTIPNTTLWVILNILEFGLSPREAVDAPRTHHPWFPDVLRLEGLDWEPMTLESLKGMGHELRVGGIQGDAHTIAVDPDGKIHGVPDRRRKTSRASGD
ncbi:gamma-glutamyltransferase family protein [Tundrisphaera lichenicola]|uniref:gamma-glutamyltransferase family protein n=1 Tax=Tundrisphaera lichenicola TaxID=2029860 RepID=UPI003EB7E38B